MLRIFSLIGMLIVLGLIIARASDPRLWSWLASDESAATTPRPASSPAGKLPVNAQPPKETVTPGPTDEDFIERAAAVKEFMALTDGGLEQNPEEMLAYWRLFGWVQHQSTAQLQKRASKVVVFSAASRFSSN
jgi:hypothetical protein